MKAFSPQTNTLTVSWSHIPKHKVNGILQGYKVFYRSLVDNGNFSDIEVGSTALQATIKEKLNYVTLYEVRVAGITLAGVGVKSDPISVRPGKLIIRTYYVYLFIYFYLFIFFYRKINFKVNFNFIQCFTLMSCDS